MGKRAKTRRELREQAEKVRKEYLQKIEQQKNPWVNFWRRIDIWIYTVCLLFAVAYPFIMKDKMTIGDQAIIHTSKGDIEVELYDKDAPKTVENFTKLAQRGYYNNLTWHRVIKGFMIQGGDPEGTGQGGESAFGNYFEDEINPRSQGLTSDEIKNLEGQGYKYNYNLSSHKVDVGSLAMANAGPNTNGSQFFIVTEQAQPHLNGKHTVFGKVTKGLEIAVVISQVEVDENDRPKEPVTISSIELK